MHCFPGFVCVALRGARSPGTTMLTCHVRWNIDQKEKIALYGIREIGFPCTGLGKAWRNKETDGFLGGGAACAPTQWWCLTAAALFAPAEIRCAKVTNPRVGNEICNDERMRGLAVIELICDVRFYPKSARGAGISSNVGSSATELEKSSGPFRSGGLRNSDRVSFSRSPRRPTGPPGQESAPRRSVPSPPKLVLLPERPTSPGCSFEEWFLLARDRSSPAM